MSELENLIQNGKSIQLKNNPKIKDDDKAKQLSVLSMKQYVATIKKLHRELNVSVDITNLLWLQEYKNEIVTFITTLNSPNTIKTYLSIVIALLNNDLKKYNELIKFFANISNSNYDNIKIHVKKDKACDDKRIITLKEYDALIKMLAKNSCDAVEYLMFLILRHYPIRNEVGTLIYIKNTDFVKLDKATIQAHNWIVEKSKSIEMIRYQFKTAKFYAKELPFIDTIKQPVKAALKKYIKDKNINSNTPLFAVNDIVLTENQVSQKLAYISEKNLGVKISTSTVFKILACDAVKNNSIDEARKLLFNYSKIRGTNLSTIIEYYVNGNVINNDD
jgi:hypothetical protein